MSLVLTCLVTERHSSCLNNLSTILLSLNRVKIITSYMVSPLHCRIYVYFLALCAHTHYILHITYYIHITFPDSRCFHCQTLDHKISLSWLRMKVPRSERSTLSTSAAEQMRITPRMTLLYWVTVVTYTCSQFLILGDRWKPMLSARKMSGNIVMLRTYIL